jgi:hypothetical protein
MPRSILLEHTAAPDDPAGRHFDLLLENGASCRTWRLTDMPQPGGPAVAAVELPAHRLAWLDTVEADVSGNRGHVRRVDAGTFTPLFLDTDSLGTATRLVLALDGQRVSGRLRLQAVADGWAASLNEV